MRLTITNDKMGTSTRLNVPEDGIISARTAYLCRLRMRCAPGLGGALGESGPQNPLELGGKVSFEVTPLGDGRVRMLPIAIRKGSKEPLEAKTADSAAG